MRMLDTERAKYEGGGKWRTAIGGAGQTTNGTSNGISVFNGSNLSNVEDRLRQIIGHVNNPILQALLGKPVSGQEIASGASNIFRSIAGPLLATSLSNQSKNSSFLNSVRLKYENEGRTVFEKSLGEKFRNNQVKIILSKDGKTATLMNNDQRAFGEGFLTKDFWMKNPITGKGGYQGALGNAPAAAMGVAQLIGNLTEAYQKYRENQQGYGQDNAAISNSNGMSYEQRRMFLETTAESFWGRSGAWARERIASGNANIDAANSLGRDTLERNKIFEEALNETNGWNMAFLGNAPGVYSAKYHKLLKKYSNQLGLSENNSQVILAAQKGVQADMNSREIDNIKQSVEDKAASGKHNNILADQPERISNKQVIEDELEAMRKEYFHQAGISYRPKYIKEYYTMEGGTVAGAANIPEAPTPPAQKPDWFSKFQ